MVLCFLPFFGLFPLSLPIFLHNRLRDGFSMCTNKFAKPTVGLQKKMGESGSGV